MNRTPYRVGDLVLAQKKYDYDAPHYEWCVGLDYPVEYATITKVVPVTSSYTKYYIKFINGVEDCMDVSELKIVAFA